MKVARIPLATLLLLARAKQPNDDGSWSNANNQWFEGDKNLATAFALLALSHCDDEAK